MCSNDAMIVTLPSHVKRSKATMDDVAKEAGVSRALVSLVMREVPVVSEERRARVLAAAAQLDYRPNAMARQLASHQSRTIGVLLHDLRNPFFAEIFEGIEQAAEERGYRILLGTGARNARRESLTVESFLEYRVDATILVSTMLSTSAINTISKIVPTVRVSQTLRSPSGDSVTIDEKLGARLVIEHLQRLGHQRITHIDGGSELSAPPRRRGYEDAMKKAGLTPHVIPGDFTEIGGARAAEVLLGSPKRPTAIFAFNDQVAIGAMAHLEDAGLSIPRDISIVGFDNTSVASLRQINLTTVNQPREEMGRLSVDAVLDRMTTKRLTAVRHLATPTLVVRGSTGIVPGR